MGEGTENDEKVSCHITKQLKSDKNKSGFRRLIECYTSLANIA